MSKPMEVKRTPHIKTEMVVERITRRAQRFLDGAEIRAPEVILMEMARLVQVAAVHLPHAWAADQELMREDAETEEEIHIDLTEPSGVNIPGCVPRPHKTTTPLERLKKAMDLPECTSHSETLDEATAAIYVAKGVASA